MNNTATSLKFINDNCESNFRRNKKFNLKICFFFSKKKKKNNGIIGLSYSNSTKILQ